MSATSIYEAMARQRKVDRMVDCLKSVDCLDAEFLAEQSEDFWVSLAGAAQISLPSSATRAAVLEAVRHRSAA